MEDEWALVAAFIRRKETRSRDRGDASCGLVKVVDVSRFAWHKGLMYGGRGSHGEKKSKGTKTCVMFIASLGVRTWWGPREVLSDRTDREV